MWVSMLLWGHKDHIEKDKLLGMLKWILTSTLTSNFSKTETIWRNPFTSIIRSGNSITCFKIIKISMKNALLSSYKKYVTFKHSKSTFPRVTELHTSMITNVEFKFSKMCNFNLRHQMLSQTFIINIFKVEKF